MWVFIDFSIENMIIECENVKIFACGALEGGRSSKNLTKPLILIKIGAEGAEKNGILGPKSLKPLVLVDLRTRGGFKL